MEIRHLPICHRDARGTIRDLFASQTPDATTLITSTPGAIRGNHVHDASTQHAVVLSGRMWAYHRSPGEVARRTLLHPGDLVTHPPGEEHAYVAEVETSFLALAEGVRRGGDYELDTRRVPSLVDDWRARRGGLVCSVLVPSRARPQGLLAAVMSAGETASPGAVEVLVRLDEDDVGSLAVARQLSAAGSCSVRVGSRGAGYDQLADFYDELSRVAEAPWTWVMNDDARIVGAGWDRELASLPLTGVLAQPDVYQLGASRYARCERGAFPIVPTRVWQRFGHAAPHNSIDVWLHDLLAGHGWRTRFLERTEVVHDRADEETLARHRRIGP